MDRIITAIDLGSNSFRVLKYDFTHNSVLGEYEQTVGTADGLSKSGDISQEALKRIIDAVEKSIEVVNYDPKRAVAVTTQALRIANNSKHILKEIKDATGVNFEIIDGQKEAELTLLAMQYALKRENIKDDDFILLDIGGGSTELIFYKDHSSFIKSFPYGIVTLTQSNNKVDDLKKFENMIVGFIDKLNIELTKSIFVSTAGTPTTIAALKHGLNYTTYDKAIVNGTRLSLKDIDIIQKRMKNMSKELLIEKVGTGREDYINTGVEIFKFFYKVLNKDISIVFDDGLREGVAISQYELGIDTV